MRKFCSNGFHGKFNVEIAVGVMREKITPPKKSEQIPKIFPP